MSKTRVYVDEQGRSGYLNLPKILDESLKLTIPEFRGTTEGKPFAIQQVLKWTSTEPQTKIRFKLDGDPTEVGIEFKGSLSATENEVLLSATVRNSGSEPIQSGHHSLHLDLSASSEFADPTGERTFVYAETGWASVAQLIDPIHSRKHTIRIGASYNKSTVMWKMMARLNEARDLCLGLALDKGYVFGSDHPDWPTGILGGYRWGTINPSQSKNLSGKIYLFKGGLNDLRLRYTNDFK